MQQFPQLSVPINHQTRRNKSNHEARRQPFWGRQLSLQTGFHQHSSLPQPARPAPQRHSRQAGRNTTTPPPPPLQAPPPPPLEGWEAQGQRQGLCGSGMSTTTKALTTLSCSSFTFLVHCLTVMTSSEMTMSTHLVQGSLIFPICLFTMVSKAISGVKRPVLPVRERTSHGAE